MDSLAETGSRWFCTAAHAVGATSFEMQTCDDFTNRYWIGVSTVLAGVALVLAVLWHVAFRERGVG